MMKQAANKTASMAGDGTTTAIVLTEAIVKAGVKHITESNNSTEVVRGKIKVDDIIKELTKKARKVNGKKILDVATISANNDKELGDIISKAYKEVGANGIVTVEKSKTSETYAEITNGIKITEAIHLHYLLITIKKMSVLWKVDFGCDSEITNILQIENVKKMLLIKEKSY